MKKIYLFLIALCAVTLVSCGTSSADKVEKLYEAAIVAAQEATSIEALDQIEETLAKDLENLSKENDNAEEKDYTELIQKFDATLDAKKDELKVLTPAEKIVEFYEDAAAQINKATTEYQLVAIIDAAELEIEKFVEEKPDFEPTLTEIDKIVRAEEKFYNAFDAKYKELE